MHQPVIEATSVNFSYGSGETSEQVLRDVNLSIEPGKIIVLAGPSGSGKTTLLTLIGGLRSMQSGSLRVLDCQLENAGDNSRRRLRNNIGFIFQQHNLLTFLTAEQNVQMAMSTADEGLREGAREAAREALAAVGLENRLHFLPCQLSGGQRQRVAVARALVRKPKLILADEPTASLDSESGLNVATLFRGHADDNGASIVLVTHDPRITSLADRTIHLRDGRIADMT